MGVFLVHSCTIVGIEAVPVSVEVVITSGLPNFTIVGLAGAAVQESKERVRAAILHSKFKFPRGRITINLSPADIKKAGPLFDLAIALGILGAQKVFIEKPLANCVVVGELGLTGEVRRIRGVLACARMAKSANMSLIHPMNNTSETSLLSGLIGLGIPSLKALVQQLSKESIEIGPIINKSKDTSQAKEAKLKTGLEHVSGQPFAKRALEIAATGKHNLLLSGPPGSGKSMMAKAFASILPDLSNEECIDSLTIHSIGGEHRGNVLRPPVRAPHHSCSVPALIGGGKGPKPGEVSLAHGGVLFLDEFGEFSKRHLDHLRQPLEDGLVRISRTDRKVTFPSKFQLIAAMNPCPCGYKGSQRTLCSCNPALLSRYASKLSGPILDRIDMFVDVPKVELKDLHSAHPSTEESSLIILARVKRARTFLGQQKAPPKERLSSGCEALLAKAFVSLNLSARSYKKVLSVSSTIAALDEASTIQSGHISEALLYRRRPRV